MAEATAEIGELIDGRYRITSILGTGGMGSVFRAEHMTIRRPVAVKLLHKEFAEDPTFAKRFEREAFVTGRTSHPNCVNVSDFGKLENGTLYLVMELVDGELLADVLDADTRIEWSRALRIVRHVLRGLAHAHAADVVHRDVKPENVIIVQGESDPDFSKILDFGIAKLVGNSPEAGDNQLTRIGTTVGTPTYVAPEQALGQAVDGRADLYSLSVMLYEMIAGTPPFYSEDTLRVLSMHVATPVPPFAERVPDIEVPEAVEALVRKGLEKDRGDRHATAEDYIAAIDAVIGAAPVRAQTPLPVRMDTPPPMRVDTPPPARADTPVPVVATAPTDVAIAPPPAHAVSLAMPVGPTYGSRIKLYASAAAILGVVVVIAVVTSGAPSGGASKEVVAVPIPTAPGTMAIMGKPKQTELSRRARELMAKGDPAETIRMLEHHALDIAGDPYSQIELGHAQFALGNTSRGIEAYKVAVTLHEDMRDDDKLRANAGLAADSKDGMAQLEGLEFQSVFLKEDSAKTRLADIASADRRAEIRKHARQLAKSLGIEDRVDKVNSLILDLSQEKECEIKKQIIAKLKSLDDKRAIKPIKRARNHKRGTFFGMGGSRTNKCLRVEADAALAHLSKLPN